MPSGRGSDTNAPVKTFAAVARYRSNRPAGLLARLGIVLLTVMLLSGMAGCRSGGRALIVAGSTSVQPVMEKIAGAFRKTRPDLRVDIEGGGSSAGLMAIRTKTAALAMSSRELKQNDPQEAGLWRQILALDAIAIIVHPDNPVASLSLSQIRGLFAGSVKSWKEVGGPDRPVHILVREEGSGTRSAFEELVMKDGKAETPIDDYALVQDSSGGVREVVRGDRDAVGFVSMGALNPYVKAIAVDGTTPTFETVRGKQYRLVRPFFLAALQPPAGDAADLVRFSLGSEAARILQTEGLVGVFE